jgi:hypothetical protein
MAAKRSVSLHEAIAQVLGNRAMTYQQVADIINARRMFVRDDGMPVPAEQVRARVHQYKQLFHVDKRQIPHLVMVSHEGGLLRS